MAVPKHQRPAVEQARLVQRGESFDRSMGHRVRLPEGAAVTAVRDTTPAYRRLHIRVGQANMPIDIVSRSKALEAILSATAESWGYVVTPNAQHLQILRQRPDLRDIYGGARFSLADGWPVAVISSMVARAPVERVPGSDLMEAVLDSNGAGRPLVFVGGNDGDFWRRLAARARATNWDPLHEPAPRAELEDPRTREALLTRVGASALGGIVVVGVGAPRQELLARELCERPGNGVVLCLGMSINFSSGAIRRAPKWLQAVGLEWAHRALLEPRRLLPRYAENFLTLIKTTQENAFR